MNKHSRGISRYESTTRLWELLKDAARHPSKYFLDTPFVEALKSQGKLAKFSSIALEISPSSINTLKRTIAKKGEFDFRAFDFARIAALDAIREYTTATSPGKKTSKERLQNKVKELERLLFAARHNEWQLTMAFQKSLEQGRYYANKVGDSAIKELCAREQKELLMTFSLLTQAASENDET